MAATVTQLLTAAVKGTRMQSVPRITLSMLGAIGDRRFLVIDDQDRMLNGKQLAVLQTVIASYDLERRTLALELPDGARIEDEVLTGGPVWARFYSGTMPGNEVIGPFAEVLSELTGRQLRLVEAQTAVDRPIKGAASLYSRSSLRRLAQQAGVGQVDGRRFRMLIEIDGIDAHSEDGWVGKEVQVGGATVRFTGHVGRCLVTTRNPDSASPDLPTLDLLRAYRDGTNTTEPLSFGIYGQVLSPGEVTVGDPVLLAG